MAKESSFDIVSSVDMQEADNAFQQTRKELTQRYDLKASGATIDFDRSKGLFTINAPSDFVASQVIDVLGSKLVRRKIDLNALSWGSPVVASGGRVRRDGQLINGIDKDTASRIAKDLRGLKLKAKVSIEGDKLRVSSASKDTLQEVIGFLRDQDYGQPLQFVNYR